MSEALPVGAVAASRRSPNRSLQTRGDITLPDGWQECRLGDLFENRKERGYQGLPTLSVTMNYGLVDRDEMDRKQDSALSAEEHRLVRAGDIAYNTMRMWQGAFGLADVDGVAGPSPDVQPGLELHDHGPGARAAR
jgi:hypothetical protein